MRQLVAPSGPAGLAAAENFANLGLIGMVATAPERPSNGFTLFAVISTASSGTLAYGVSHQVHRRSQAVRRTKTHGRPAKVDSPWIE